MIHLGRVIIAKWQWIGHGYSEEFLVADCHSLLQLFRRDRGDNLIMGHNCIINATSIGTNIRFPAVLQLLFAQVTFYKARKSVCCFFSWYVVFCFVFPSSRKLADQKTRKSIDWVDFRLLHYAGEVTYCAVGECVWKLPELLSHYGR